MLLSHSIEIAQTKFEVSCKVLHSREKSYSPVPAYFHAFVSVLSNVSPSATNCDRRRWTCDLHAAWRFWSGAQTSQGGREQWSWDKELHRELLSCLTTNCKKRNNSRQSAIFITMPVVESQLKREKNLCRFSFSKISGFVWLWGPKLNSFGNR